MKPKTPQISIQPSSQQAQLRKKVVHDLTPYVIFPGSRKSSDEETTLEGNIHCFLDIPIERKSSYQEKTSFEDQKPHIPQNLQNELIPSSNSINQMEFSKKLLLPLGSQIWSADDGQFGSSPFSSPAEGRLLGSHWSTAAATPYEVSTDRAWKKYNIRINKIGVFSQNEGSSGGEDSRIEMSENERSGNPGVNRLIDENNNGEEQVEMLEEIDTVRVNINPTAPQQVHEEPTRPNDANRPRQSVAQQLQNIQPQNQQLNEKLEAKLFIQKSLLFFIAVVSLSACFTLTVTRQCPFEYIFFAAYTSFLLYAFQNIIRACSSQREAWRRKDDIFCVFDSINGIIFVASIQLKLSGLISASFLGFIPFVIITFCYSLYCISSKAPSSLKAKNAAIRCFYALQAFLLTAKVDNVIDWNWGGVFAFAFIFMAVMSLYFAAYFLLLVLAILFSTFKHRLFEDMNQGKQYLGLIWHLLSYGLGVMGFMMLLGVQRAYTVHGDFELLRRAVIGELGLSGFLVILTLVAIRPLNGFIEILNHAENSAVGNATQDSENGERKLNLEVEKKESYFVMLSSTYFLPMEGNFFTKNEKKIQKIKSLMLSNFLPWKTKNSTQVQNNARLNVEVLKEYKEALDLKFTKIAKQQPEKQGPKRSKRSSKPRNTLIKAPVQSFLNYNDAISNDQKIHLSADDINIKGLGLTEESQKVGEEDMVCYLCCSNPPDAVLMKCGHGGICYECANVLIKKKNECMQCRAPVDAIYKVDPTPKLSNIIKGLELCKVNFS